jgi:hypothetical protein
MDRNLHYHFAGAGKMIAASAEQGLKIVSASPPEADKRRTSFVDVLLPVK